MSGPSDFTVLGQDSTRVHYSHPSSQLRSGQKKTPLVTFHRFIPTARLPQRADRSAAGSLPTRAFRYCEPSTSASGYGYYIFPPISFSLQWDGRDVMWTWEGAGTWLPLKSAQFPNFRDLFDSVAPAEIREYSPPFLGALQEPGLIQLLDRHRRPHCTGLEPDGARARQRSAQRNL